MRCRKVRSFLSAYCRDELQSNRRRQVSEHLLGCPACRRQEAVCRDMNTASQEMPTLKVTDGFNQRLLQRVAQERFAETRTKAHLPKAAPLFMWRKLVPAVATACVALLAVIVTLSPSFDGTSPQYAATESGLDDSYLTVQPTGNPNMTVRLKDDWSLTDHLAQAERINRISNSVIPARSFSRTGYSGDQAMLTSGGSRPMPFVANHFRMRPVVRIFVVPQSTVEKEGSDAY